jgi:hypothetical protein
MPSKEEEVLRWLICAQLALRIPSGISVTTRKRKGRGGYHEREKQGVEGRQEGAPIESQREKKAEEGEEDQVRRFSCPSALLMIVFLYFFSGCNQPTLKGINPDKIDPSQDPIQKSRTSDEPIVKEGTSGRFEMTPLADYQISGVVVGRGSYSSVKPK